MAGESLFMAGSHCLWRGGIVYGGESLCRGRGVIVYGDKALFMSGRHCLWRGDIVYGGESLFDDSPYQVLCSGELIFRFFKI
jgi:hypothetical protein